MARSMTGFGCSEDTRNNRKINLEIKAINNRYCDIQIRQPRLFFQLENKIRNKISNVLVRGKIELKITYLDNNEDSVKVMVDKELALSCMKAYQTIATITKIPFTDLNHFIAAHPDVLRIEKQQFLVKEVEAQLMEVLDEALKKLIEMREMEGQALVRDILLKKQKLDELYLEVKLRAPLIPQLYKERLLKQLKYLSQDANISEFYDGQRVASEIAIFSDKCAIDEELVRLASHLKQLEDVLQETGAIGKKLDFLIQEINREINTIASKANDLHLTDLAIAMKSELEKIREQVQNIE